MSLTAERTWMRNAPHHRLCKPLISKQFQNRTESAQSRGSEKNRLSEKKTSSRPLRPSGRKMKKARQYWAFLPPISPGEPAPPAVLAEREGFELSVRRWFDRIENAQRVSAIWPLGGVANLEIADALRSASPLAHQFAPETIAVKWNKHD
jgi:hypothetical protein